MKILKCLLVNMLFLLCFVSNVNAMTYDGWTTIKLENEIEFQIPPILEVQSLDYKLKSIGTPYEHLVYPDGYDKFIAQQKGLNDNWPEAYKHYVRVFVYLHNSDEEFPPFGESFDCTEEELKIFENAIVFNDHTALEVLQPAKVIDVNGNMCINLKYLSQNVGNPTAIRDKYYFFNGNKIYEISLMIRSTEFDLWTTGKNDIRKIVNTLKLVDG